ncbi:phage GP46 family protein [Komagataeibacter xylinus]|uniref:Phage tail protein n=1 Tax=Komagataeibacter xylinus TaxID=28448 RepID=A0A857FQM0_KOMXY|nr:phage GP46 family protein [Komagataeibacter xylinus]QHC36466.1 hypothetical protein FMA36_14015 [Komagataeibacter xylinus]
MTDIRLVYDNTRMECDWVITNGDLDTDADLETAVLFSLFTDAPAPSGTVIPDGTNDLRGCWIDGMESFQMGSLLWTIEGAKKSGNGLLTHARTICEQALQWMIDAGIVGAITVRTSWLNANSLNIRIQLTKPDGSPLSFQYAWAWRDTTRNALSTANPF